jgi:beta-glucosidase
MHRFAVAATAFVLLLSCSDVLANPFRGTWMNEMDPAELRATALLREMSLEEKVAMLHGPSSGSCCECDEKEGPLCNYTGNIAPNSRLGIPQIKMNDGPQGFRDNKHPGTSTSWPSAMTVAASWDEELLMEYGVAMGKEFAGKGANVQLGPGVCLARIPQNGRNFEYISGEDPFLGYTLVQPVVRGIQSQGVIANAKHYALNNQETNRSDRLPAQQCPSRPYCASSDSFLLRTTVSDDADERTRFEMYYPPFAGAIEAGVGSFMCSYNKIYGTWACENNSTLNRDLKQVMNFKGFVMSDWGATHSTSIEAGLDVEMPGADFMGAKLLSAVQSQQIDEAFVDDAGTIYIAVFYRPLFAHVLRFSLSHSSANVHAWSLRSPQLQQPCK